MSGHLPARPPNITMIFTVVAHTMNVTAITWNGWVHDNPFEWIHLRLTTISSLAVVHDYNWRMAYYEWAPQDRHIHTNATIWIRDCHKDSISWKIWFNEHFFVPLTPMIYVISFEAFSYAKYFHCSSRPFSTLLHILTRYGDAESEPFLCESTFSFGDVYWTWQWRQNCDQNKRVTEICKRRKKRAYASQL